MAISVQSDSGWPGSPDGVTHRPQAGGTESARRHRRCQERALAWDTGNPNTKCRKPNLATYLPGSAFPSWGLICPMRGLE